MPTPGADGKLPLSERLVACHFNGQRHPRIRLEPAILVQHVVPVEGRTYPLHVSHDPFLLDSSEEEDTDDVSPLSNNHQLSNHLGRLEPRGQTGASSAATWENKKRTL